MESICLKYYNLFSNSHKCEKNLTYYINNYKKKIRSIYLARSANVQDEPIPAL